jgi:hypothetical protein
MFVMSGCAALTSAKSTADSAKGTADDAKSQKDSATATVKDEKGKAKGGDGAAGGEAPAGATRLEASDAPTNTPISDKIDFKKGKINDWRKFALVGKPGYATFILHWDEETANLDLDVYDSFGTKIGKSPPRLEGQSERKILLRVTDAGTYYVKVSGPTKADNSIYTMEVKWAGAPPPPKPDATVQVQVQQAQQPPPQPGQVVPPPGTPAPCPAGQVCLDPNKVYGSIVQMVRENGGVTLYLDKGSSDKLHAGMQGTILDGPDGDKPFEGGSFAITQVVDSGKSIARSTTLQKSLGKNRRISVNLK